VTVALTIALLSHLVERDTRTQFFSAQAVPSRDVAVVFGAGVRPDGSLAAALEDRVLTAIELYRAGKVKKLLMSGDNSIVGYDEPTAMKRYAVEQGVPADDVTLDFAGFHTYDTCYRARAIFGVTGAVLVTQRYHLARALFTCQGLGLDVVGVPADRQRYHRYSWYVTREQVSRARAYLQVRLLKPRPKFLGKQEPIL
jgi:vancomycin permeability regulator SanA